MSPSDVPTVPLASLACGSKARLHTVPADHAPLLGALGLGPETQLSVRRTGDPTVVEIGTTRLGLSGPIARSILVCPSPDESLSD